MIKLRSYQQDIVDAVSKQFRQENRIVMSLPTGAGKTVCFSYMCQKTSMKTLVLADRVELLERTKETLEEFGLKPQMIAPRREYDLSAPLLLGMVETVARRHKKDLKQFELIIIDEAHKKTFDKLFPYFSEDAFILGVTATPLPTKNYSSIVEGVKINNLIDMGYLSTPEYYGVDVDLSGVRSGGGDYLAKALAERYESKKIYTGVVENWKEITPGTKTLLFSPNVASSKRVCQEFQNSGVDARHLDGTMSPDERASILGWFKETQGVLCNVGICTTGFDMPSIETVILYRATKSLALYLQMIGRGARITETSKRFTVLDFGNNVKRHGFWEDIRKFSLEVIPREKGEAPVKLCKKCSAMNRASAPSCWNCGFLFPKQEKKEIKTKLQKIVNPNKPQERIWDRIKRTAKTKEDVELIVALYGYKPSWIYANRFMLKKYLK